MLSSPDGFNIDPNSLADAIAKMREHSTEEDELYFEIMTELMAFIEFMGKRPLSVDQKLDMIKDYIDLVGFEFGAYTSQKESDIEFEMIVKNPEEFN